MNPLMGKMGPAGMQANPMLNFLAAMKNGQSPAAALQAILGKNTPMRPGENLQQTAQRLCQEKGLPFEQALGQAEQIMGQLGFKR